MWKETYMCVYDIDIHKCVVCIMQINCVYLHINHLIYTQTHVSGMRYIYIYIYTYIYIYMYMYIYRYICVYIYIYIYIYMYICIYICIYIYITYAYTYVYTYTYTYAQICHVNRANRTFSKATTAVAKTHRIPYLYRSFSAKVTYI